MDAGIKPLDYRSKICGPALTVLGQLSVRRMAMTLAEPGDILVIAANGNTEYSCLEMERHEICCAKACAVS